MLLPAECSSNVLISILTNLLPLKLNATIKCHYIFMVLVSMAMTASSSSKILKAAVATKKVLEDYEEVAVQPLIEVNKCLLIIKTFLWGREAIEAWLGVQAMRSFGLYLRLRLYNGCDKGHISDRSRKG